MLRFSAALLFGDTRKPYNSVILELVLGPLLTPTEREALIEGANMAVLRKQQVLVDLEQGHCQFQDLPLPQNVVQVVREWQRLAWFLVGGPPSVFIHNIGVKPGDPTADVLFAFAFHCCHPKLLETLICVTFEGLGCVQWKRH